MSNRKRGNRVEVYLSDAEHRHLRRQLSVSGLTYSVFIRQLIAGVQLHPRRPDEYTQLLRELSAMGNNINQIARVANTDKCVDPDMLKDIMQMQAVIWQRIKEL